MTMHSDESSMIRLNIGGKKFCTTVDTLTQREPHSMLAAMFSGRHTVCKDSDKTNTSEVEVKKIRKMTVMEKLRMFVVEEPVVSASCLIGGFDLFLPAVVRPILDSFDSAKQVPQPALSDVIAGMTGKW